MTKIQNSKRERFTELAKSNRTVALKTVAAADKCILCRLHYKKFHSSINLPALNEVFAGLKYPSIIGGNSAKKDADRFSYWAARPKEVFEFRAGQNDPFAKLQKALEKYKLERDCQGNHTGLPLRGIFRGGWMGYFSYELGRYIEKLPETTIDDFQMPLIRLCFYDRFIAYDHLEETFWLIALQMPNDTKKPQEKLASLEKLLTDSEKLHIPSPPPADIENIDFSQIRCNMDKSYYLEAIEKIKRYIYDGDVYQINFSQRFECDYQACPIDLFHWQNHYNTSPYAAYIDAGNFHIVSASPEMFITTEDGIISTKPIKGTRPRVSETGRGKKINAKNFDELIQSEKEQAELNMIVDLERNDIARICEPGTRKVVQQRTIENYPTVFHAVATVAGRLRKDITFCDILEAMFPGGSITGAPKIRSMEIIDETEPTARGVYTGSIGYIGLDGSVSLNIAIRTIIIKGQTAFAQTGGGIVADSDPQAEWDETTTKARALLAGIKAVQNNEEEKA
ncbi:MAG: anthranilate synthase component I family protein [Planctomycetes bacterium]|nr:anthranilate synthase component I family protein [Planctomycetota bacterium]